MTPMPRAAVCRYSGKPCATAASTRACIVRYCSPPGSRCSQVIDRGRPLARASCSTKSNSASKRSGPCIRSKSLTTCTTPCWRPAKAWASPHNSAALATEAGVSRPSAVRWLSERPVEKPAAPASSAAFSSSRMAAMSSAVAASRASARAPITRMRSGSCGTMAR